MTRPASACAVFALLLACGAACGEPERLSGKWRPAGRLALVASGAPERPVAEWEPLTEDGLAVLDHEVLLAVGQYGREVAGVAWFTSPPEAGAAFCPCLRLASGARFSGGRFAFRTEPCRLPSGNVVLAGELDLVSDDAELRGTLTTNVPNGVLRWTPTDGMPADAQLLPDSVTAAAPRIFFRNLPEDRGLKAIYEEERRCTSPADAAAGTAMDDADAAR